MGKGPFWILLGYLLLASGCSNDSGTSGPQMITVELNVTAQSAFHGVPGATVLVNNLRAVTDTSGLAMFHTDINVLVPNHTYQITVIAGNLIQPFPEQDTIRIPSSPNTPTGYVLETFVFMKPPDS